MGLVEYRDGAVVEGAKVPFLSNPNIAGIDAVLVGKAGWFFEIKGGEAHFFASVMTLDNLSGEAGVFLSEKRVDKLGNEEGGGMFRVVAVDDFEGDT